MANELGSTLLESPADEFEKEIESSYRIISYVGSQLPLEYQNLIRGPFLNSLRYGNDLFKLIDQESYYKAYSRYIDSLVARPRSIVKMAVLSDNTVLGWSLAESDVLHYVWVKKEVRRQGIAKALMPKDLKVITHLTNKGISMWIAKYPDVKFNPFI